jgi:(5-formylfuran-3-yl)methyl phosphate synthase
MNETPQLLVSVRSAAEALTALEGGAALIDVKEPANGSLGRADAPLIRAVVRAVARRRPVSAALGEWIDDAGSIPDADLTYVKWGLAGCNGNADWRPELTKMLSQPARPQLVLVAYADAECAKAPPVEAVFALAAEHPGSVMLLDTHCKDSRVRRTLLDWLPVPWVADLCARARAAKVKVALAGSLGLAEIRTLLPIRPDWFAVRGAACEDGDRQAGVQLVKVRQLVQLLRES